MNEFNPVIAVANDFSSESKCAIAHAALFAKRDGCELLLIHILDNKAKKEGHIDEAIKNLVGPAMRGNQGGIRCGVPLRNTRRQHF